MIYVLIIILSGSYIEASEFTTMEACNKGKAIYKEIADRKYPGIAFQYECKAKRI